MPETHLMVNVLQ